VNPVFGEQLREEFGVGPLFTWNGNMEVNTGIDDVIKQKF